MTFLCDANPTNMYTVFISLCLISFVHGSYDLCVFEQNTSCSNQLWPVGVSNNSCTVIYHNRSQCDDEIFKTSHSTLDFGRVALKAFQAMSSTAFNVTLHDIKWKQLRMKFKQRFVKEQCLCRTFFISNDLDVPSDKYVYFDCPWSVAAFEGKIVDFEYEYGVDYLVGRKYSFVVPKREEIYTYVEDIKQFSLFIYVDSSDLRNLILKIPHAPSKFNITHYEIGIYRTRDNQTDHIDTMIVSVSETKYDEIEYVYSTYGNYGGYFFTVKPVHPNCDAYHCLSKTPIIEIPKTSVVLTIGIVSITTLLASILIVIYLWIKHCRRKALQIEQEKSILLVSIPPNDAHTKVVLALGAILRDTYNLNVMIDIINVPLTKTKDPFDWFTHAFHNASHIVFLLSQNKETTTKNVYQNIDNLAIRLVKEEFAKSVSKKQYAVILFPYSTKRIPEELASLKTFSFMDDFYGFVNWLENKSFWEKIEARVDILSDHYRNQLIDSIKMVENNLISDNEVESSDQVDYKLSDVNLETIQLIKTEPNSSSDKTTDFLYNVNDLNLTGINQLENEKKSVKDNQTKYNVHDLDL